MDFLILYISGLVVLGTLAQWLAWRFRQPAILLLLLLGFAVGGLGRDLVPSDIRETIFDDLPFAFVSLAVAVILFEGGLSLRWNEFEESASAIIRLITIGVLVTWLLSAAAAHLLFGFDLDMALLLGAILSVSGPTVVVPLLTHVRPTPRVAAVAKWEGIVNDPVAATLAVLVFEVVRTGAEGGAATLAVQRLALMILVGTTIGFCSAGLVIQFLKRHWVPDYLQSALVLAAVLGSFAISNHAQSESGLITATVFGIALANQSKFPIRHLVEFKEQLRVLLIASVFILLASMIDLHSILELHWQGVAFLGALMAIRPLAVFLSTWRTGILFKERLFLSWLAPRGIVAAAMVSLFSLELAAGEREGFVPASTAEQAAQLVPIVFLTITGTVVVYGLTLSAVARRLGVSDHNPQGILFVGAEPVVRAIAKAVQEEGFAVRMVDTNPRNISAARMAGLPGRCASILSDNSPEGVNLGGIGRLLAMTPSHEVNTLAAIEYLHLFGRSNVYQLVPTRSVTKRHDSSIATLRGRPLFANDATFPFLAFRLGNGAEVKSTTLSEEFTFDDYRARYGESAVPLFIVDADGRLAICDASQEAKPRAGHTVIALVDVLKEELTGKSEAPASGSKPELTVQTPEAG